MRRIVVLLFAVCALFPARGQDKPVLKDNKERMSYGLGAYMGEYWQRQGLEASDLDMAVVMDGFKSKMAGSPKLDEREVRAVIRELSATLQDRFKRKQIELAEKNKREGAAYQAENKGKPGVHTLPSGLHYNVLKEGSGNSPTTNDAVVVKYRGALIDGTRVTNPATEKDGQPPMPMQSMKGLVDALQLMKPGDKWHLVIPPDLAHGEGGSYPLIGPNATLVYDIELVSVFPGAPLPNKPTALDRGEILQVPSAGELKQGGRVELIQPGQPPRKVEIK